MSYRFLTFVLHAQLHMYVRQPRLAHYIAVLFTKRKLPEISRTIQESHILNVSWSSVISWESSRHGFDPSKLNIMCVPSKHKSNQAVCARASSLSLLSKCTCIGAIRNLANVKTLATQRVKHRVRAAQLRVDSKDGSQLNERNISIEGGER